jgi:hypothetical protein
MQQSAFKFLQFTQHGQHAAISSPVSAVRSIWPTCSNQQSSFRSSFNLANMQKLAVQFLQFTQPGQHAALNSQSWQSSTTKLYLRH